MPPKYIPKAPIGRMIKDAGADRISSGIIDEIGEMMETYGMKLAKKAVMVCKFQQGKTVKRRHIQAALNIENEMK